MQILAGHGLYDLGAIQRGFGIRNGLGGGPPAPPAAGWGAHRYWRVSCIEDNAGPGAAIALTKLEFLDENDASLATGGTASASNEAFGAAANAFDGSTSTFWASNSDDNHWIQYDWGAGNTVDVKKIRMTPRDGTNKDQAPKHGYVSYSDDGVNWTMVFAFTQTTWTALTPVTVDGTPDVAASRYWRVYMTRSYVSKTSAQYTFSEVELRSEINGADVAAGGTASASTTFSGFPASNAFDNVLTTLWATSGAAGDQWIEYDFGAGNDVAIKEVVLRARHDTLPDQYPRVGFVQRSDDGISWTTAFSFGAGATAPALEESRAYNTGEPVPAEVFRVTKNVAQNLTTALNEVAWEVEEFNTMSGSFAANRWTVPSGFDGRYGVLYAGMRNATDRRVELEIRVSTDGGSTWDEVGGRWTQFGTNNEGASVCSTGVRLMNAGDIYQVRAASNATVAMSLVPSTFFSGRILPVGINAHSVFRATVNATQAIGATTETGVTFGTVSFDPDSNFAANVFTVPAALNGQYGEFFANMELVAFKLGNLKIQVSTDGGSSWTDVANEYNDNSYYMGCFTGPLLMNTGDKYRAALYLTASGTVENKPSVNFSGQIMGA